MLAYRSTVAAVTLAGAVLGCADPEQPTDLRKDGPPSVTTVMILSDLTPDRIVETATYCRLNDVKRPGLVGLPDIRVIQVCPEDLTQPAPQEGKVEAAPPAWFVRIVFDELLDPNVEDLVTDSSGRTYGTLQNTQPVTLICNGAPVPYDGYYVPNGNRLSWPLGPALYIEPNDPASVPTDATCTVALPENKDSIVHNKAGEPVSGQRGFDFKLAPMALLFSDPDPASGTNGDILQNTSAPVDFFWTAAINPSAAGTAPLDPNLVKISSGPNLSDGNADPAVCDGTAGAAVDPMMIQTSVAGNDPTTDALVLEIIQAGGWAPNTTYLLTFDAGATVQAAQGGPPGTLADYKLCFHTPAPSP